MASVGEQFKFKCFPGMLSKLPAKALSSLQADCLACFTCREVDDGDNYSVGSTFFVKADAVPRCGAEKLALDIFNLHTQGMSFDASNSGAEWWTQHIDHRDDIAFHWDRDYAAEEGEGEHVHPILGTVTYLCDRAAPTVIFDKRGDFQFGDDISGPLHKCLISQPTIGRHICFDGQLLHGAPSDFAFNGRGEEVEGTRITFLVNIWINAVPQDSEPLGEDVVKKLKLKVADVLPFDLTRKIAVHEFDLNGKSSGNVWKWQLNSSKDDYIIEVQLPDIASLPGCKSQELVDCLVLEQGSSKVYPGLMTVSDDEDNDDSDEEDSEDGSESIDIGTEDSEDDEEDEEEGGEGEEEGSEGYAESDDSFVDDTDLRVQGDNGESTASEDEEAVSSGKKRPMNTTATTNKSSKKSKV